MTKEKNRPILIDCDGVVGDFVGGCIEYAKWAGVNPVPTFDSVKTDTRQYPWWNEAGLEEVVKGPDFCSSIPVIPGAQEFVERLRTLDRNIMFVTSPMKDSKHWHWERQQWLEKHFNVSRTELIFATEKRYVSGLCLLDDHVGNILHWQEYNQCSAILIERPWNEDILKDCIVKEPSLLDPSAGNLYHEKKRQRVLRTNDWEVIFNRIKDLIWRDHQY